MAGVLTASVGVEDHRAVRTAGSVGSPQGVDDEFGSQIVDCGSADDASGGDVDDGRRIKPALVGGDVGVVAAPAGVDGCRVGLEVAKDRVRTGDCVRVGGWWCGRRRRCRPVKGLAASDKPLVGRRNRRLCPKGRARADVAVGVVGVRETMGSSHVRLTLWPAVFSASMNGARSPGLRREESRRTLEDLHALSQPAVLPPQNRKFLALAAGQAVSFTRDEPGPGGPSRGPLCRSDRSPWRPGLADRFPRRPSPTISALKSGMNDRRSRAIPLLSRAETPDPGCPSKRSKPRSR
ncbi:Protein of unknown function DUF2699 [Actinobacteria bacterium OV450]|nr:Protein of unknown function DUF2699 [Actinobacteria bacterium OV450]